MKELELIGGVGYDVEKFRDSLPEGKQQELDKFLSTRSVASTHLLLHDGTGSQPAGVEKHLIYKRDFEQFLEEAPLA